MATEKMMTFEEWDNETFVRNIAKFDESERRKCFESARVGMIPAENAVVIPPVGEWPEGALGCSLRFVDYDEEHFNDLVAVWSIQYLPRPKPVWVPKVGEAVFVDSEKIRVGIVSVIENTSAFVNVGSSSLWWPFAECKPFHESHIGKPWDEIPGGVE